MLRRKAEELSWRRGGGWGKEEVKALEEMLKIARGEDTFDRKYVILFGLTWGCSCRST